MGLRDKLYKVLNEYKEAYDEIWKTNIFTNPLLDFFNTDFKNEIIQIVGHKNNGLLIDSSTGVGKTTKTPWLAIMDGRITTKASKGTYIVYLFNKDERAVYLALEQSITEAKEHASATGLKGREFTKKTNQLLEQEKERVLNLISVADFCTDNKISTGKNDFNITAIAYKKYEMNILPTDVELQDDLFKMIDVYSQYYNKCYNVEQESVPISEPIKYFSKIWKISHGKGFTDDEKSRLLDSNMITVHQDTRGKAGSSVTQGDNFMHSMKKGDYFYLCYGNNVRLFGKIDSDEVFKCEVKGDGWFQRLYEIIAVNKKNDLFSELHRWWTPQDNSTCVEIPIRDYREFEQYILSPYFKMDLSVLQGIEWTKGVFTKMSEREVVDNIYKYIAESGFSYSIDMIKNLFLSLKAKPFVILAGISGTGKSKIVKLFAEAINATTDNGQYKLVPVRPDWSDSTDLLGHLNLDNRFIPGMVTEFLAEANKNENLDKPYILCLDEMNLARVEYYFSDFLSIIETRCMDGDGKIISEKLLPKSAFGSDKEAMGKYGDLYLSENVYIVGTVNMDETTFPFSKKVLDRANTIEFSEVNLSLATQVAVTDNTKSISLGNNYIKCEYMSFIDCYSDNSDKIDEVILLLNRVNDALKVIGAQVAYRVRDEISYYVTYAEQYELLTFDKAMDNAFSQKILPRIQGSSLSLRGAFRDLFKIMSGSSNFEDNELLNQIEEYMKRPTNNCRFPKSSQKIAFMLRRFEEDGYTSYWL